MQNFAPHICFSFWSMIFASFSNVNFLLELSYFVEEFLLLEVTGAKRTAFILGVKSPIICTINETGLTKVCE